MGKSLIIKGADFSANGIAPEFTELKCIIATASTQGIKSIVDIPANAQIVVSIATPTTTDKIFTLFGREFSGADVPKNFYVTQFNNRNNITGCLFYVNSSSYKTINNGFQDGSKHVLTIDRTGAKIDNGTKVNAIEQTTTAIIQGNGFGIFGRIDQSGTNFNISIGVKCYGIKIYSDRDNSNSLILDAIPVKRTSDNAVCLYDKISGEYLLTDDGTNPDYETLD